MKRLASVLLCVIAACGYQPARFASRLPVSEVHDDKPIPVPERRGFIEDLYQADVYVRRELTNGLDPRRVPEALDVNSMDQVPSSSWHRGSPDAGKLLAGYAVDGPPVPPFEVLEDAPASETPDAVAIRDARGLPYELIYDPPGREGMRTSALVVASRLVFALGYHTPETHIVASHDGRRAAATRWPVGIDLGPTPIAQTRPDDPNDFLSHLDRRTLRVLFHVTAWLDSRRLKPRMLRDVYVGKPGRGHVKHHYLGLDGALGVANYAEAVAWANNPDRQHSNFFMRMFSLGLSPKPPAYAPETEFESVGVMTPQFLPDEWDMSPPFEPTDRILPGDTYWIAKQLARIDAKTIHTALLAAQLDEGPRQWLRDRIVNRRTALLAHGYGQTTPCEVRQLAEATDATPAHLKMLDLALFQGFAPTSQRAYRIRHLDDRGEALTPDRGMAATGPLFEVPLPKALDDVDYAVIQILALNGARELPRPLEVHLRRVEKQLRLVGVRH